MNFPFLNFSKFHFDCNYDTTASDKNRNLTYTVSSDKDSWTNEETNFLHAQKGTQHR